MAKFFSSEAWFNAQVDNFITSGNKPFPNLVIFILYTTSILTVITLYSLGRKGYLIEEVPGDR